jgi:hypothetical protein
MCNTRTYVLRAGASGLLSCEIKYASEAKISQLGIGTSVTCEQDVCRFYVPMKNLLAIQILHGMNEKVHNTMC